MAIKVSNTTAITDDRKGSFTTVTTKAVDIATLQGMTGSRVGETVMCTELNGGKGQLVSWTGSEWTLPKQEIDGGVRWQSGTWTYHLFTSPGALTSALPASGEVAVLAGGGGGGSGRISGGGGAGGFRIGAVSWSIGSSPVVVGSGGAGGAPWPGYGPEPRGPGNGDAWGQPGGPSSFAGITSTGGGGCGRQGGPGGWKAGGSGAGASSWHYPGGGGQPNQGNRGGNRVGPYPGGENNFTGAGGGGWGGVGEDCNEPTAQSGRGGVGVSLFQFASQSPSGEAWEIPSGVPIGPYVPLGFAGGGSGYGGTFPSQPQGGNLAPQGTGGGGNGSYSQPKTTKNAKSYGAGGGGGGFRDTTNTMGGDGFGGFVIVRYRTNLLG